jgi:hypothetical protein
MELTSVPKIYALGTRFNANIFSGPVIIEEKIDGSQFSFCWTAAGGLQCRSKGQQIDLDDPGMFFAAVATAKRLADEGKLADGYAYQCEYLAKPKHNVLAYARVPAGNLVLFDARDHTGRYYGPEAKRDCAMLLGLEPVPVLFVGDAPPLLDSFLERDSILGNVKVEGVVVKSLNLPHPERENHPMTAKYVSPKFKEKQSNALPRPDKQNPDAVQRIVNSLRTEARWLKAVQHLREAGQLQNCEKDIGPLVKEIQKDTLEEEADWIKEQLFDGFKTEIHRGVVQGFSQYYKRMLNEGTTAFQDEVTKPS